MKASQKRTWVIIAVLFLVWFGNVSVMTAAQYEHVVEHAVQQPQK